MIVLDASAAVDMVRKTPEGLALSRLLLDGEEVITHGLFSSEVCNAFWKCGHVGRLSKEEVQAFAKEAISLVDRVCDTDDLLCEALSEAIRLDHPVSDMLYFVLARRNAATLFTLDERLRKLCLDNGVNCVALDDEF